MATKTFTALTAVTTLAAGDELVQWNASAAAARKITVANFIANSPNGGLAEKGATNTFTVTQTVESRVIAQGYATQRLSINDDAVASFSPPAGVTRGLLVISNSGSGSATIQEINGLVAIDIPGARINVITQLASRIEVSTSVLTGTTGTDAKFTVGINTASGLIYLENRVGSAAAVTALFIG